MCAEYLHTRLPLLVGLLYLPCHAVAWVDTSHLTGNPCATDLTGRDWRWGPSAMLDVRWLQCTQYTCFSSALKQSWNSHTCEGWRKCDHFTLLSTVVLWCSYYVQRLIPISSFHARVLRIASMLASCCSGCMADGKKHRCVCSTQVLCMLCKSGPFGCVGCVWPWGWACSSTVAA